MKTPLIHMSYRDADLLQYYIASLPEVKDTSVDERTGNAVVNFRKASSDNKERLMKALLAYDPEDEAVASLVPEETGRKLNREYQEKFIMQVLKHNLYKLFLPTPISIARTVVKSVPFLIKAAKALAGGHLKVETLDGIAIAASLARRDFATASSIMFLLESGEILEEWTRKKSIGDLARSMSLQVDNVWLSTDEGEIQVSVNAVRKGDHIVLRNSDIIPLDGKVISGEMTVNQSTMTGESEPVVKKADGYVYAGTVVEEGECIVEVTRESGNGKYDKIVQMIEESEKLKSNTEAKAYRLADSLVPYSLAGFGLTYLFTGNVTKALSFLMVDYSCAMKLSMPLSVLSAIREAREYGISIKGGKFMEAVAEADTIVFDKTGTLTYAAPKLMEVITFGGEDPDEMLRVAACLEEHYPHSVANAIVDGAKEKGLSHEELHSKVEYIVAHGIYSTLEGRKIIIGSHHFVFEDENAKVPEDKKQLFEELPEQYSHLYMAIDGLLAAVICSEDPLRKEAPEVIRRLKENGISKVVMMTGDSDRIASTIADKVGVDEYYSEVLPEDKAKFVEKEKNAGRKVIMIGDGINDSPALSEASVGIAISDGAEIAREIADVTISADDLYEIATLKQLSDAMVHRINKNYRLIVGINTGLIALGIAGIFQPTMSALFHNTSTILISLKSMNNLLDQEEIQTIH